MVLVLAFVVALVAVAGLWRLERPPTPLTASDGSLAATAAPAPKPLTPASAVMLVVTASAQLIGFALYVVLVLTSQHWMRSHPIDADLRWYEALLGYYLSLTLVPLTVMLFVAPRASLWKQRREIGRLLGAPGLARAAAGGAAYALIGFAIVFQFRR